MHGTLVLCRLVVDTVWQPRWNRCVPVIDGLRAVEHGHRQTWACGLLRDVAEHRVRPHVLWLFEANAVLRNLVETKTIVDLSIFMVRVAQQVFAIGAFTTLHRNPTERHLIWFGDGNTLDDGLRARCLR